MIVKDLQTLSGHISKRVENVAGNLRTACTTLAALSPVPYIIEPRYLRVDARLVQEADCRSGRVILIRKDVSDKLPNLNEETLLYKRS